MSQQISADPSGEAYESLWCPTTPDERLDNLIEFISARMECNITRHGGYLIFRGETRRYAQLAAWCYISAYAAAKTDMAKELSASTK